MSIIVSPATTPHASCSRLGGFIAIPLLLTTIGCIEGSGPGFASAAVPGDGDDPAVQVGLYPFSGPPRQGTIEVTTDPGGDPCTGPLDDCRAGYSRFLDLAAGRGTSRDESELHRWIQDAIAAPAPSGEITPDRFASAVVSALGVGFLLDQLEEVHSSVAFLADELHLGHTVHRFLIDDPWVGTLGGFFVLPEGEGPHRAILAEHGHGTEAVDWLDTYGGLDYVEAGFVLFAVDHRMMYADDGESEVGHDLLADGFTLAGIHIYESLLVHRLMRWHPAVDADHIGLLGHSAGSNRGNLMVRLTDTFGAYVSDNPTLFDFDPSAPRYHEALVPELAPWQDAIGDSQTAPTPTLEVDYGFPEGTGPLLEFFEATLGG